MNNIVKYLSLLICCSLIILSCNQQRELSSEEAKRKYTELTKDYLNRKISFETNPEAWIDYQVEFNELISKIDNSSKLILDIYHHRGYDYRVKGLYRESLNIYKEFFKIYDANESKFSEEVKKEYFKKRSFNYRGTAVAYVNLGHIDSAHLEHKKNIKLIQKVVNDNIWEPAAYNDYGMFLASSLKDTVSALIEYKKAYSYTSEKFPEDDLIQSIRNNIGSIYFNKHQFDKAYELYYTNYLYYKKYLKRHGSFYYGQKAIASATKVLEILEFQNKIKPIDALYNDVSTFYYGIINKTPKLQLAYLTMKKRHLIAHKDFKKAYQILEIIKAKSDSLKQSELTSKENLQQKLNDVTLIGLKSKNILEKKQQEAELLNQRLIIWLISIISILILCMLSFAYFRRKQQVLNAKNEKRITEQNLELSSIKNKQLNFEIESKKRDLSDFAINLTQNQEWAKVLANKIDLLKRTKGRARKKLMDEFENEVRKKTTFDTNTKVFYERLDRLSNSFYSKLNSDFPNLSKTEKRLCSLIRLQIESRNIATIQNISLGSLNTSRYRLRKKLNLAKEVDLDDFIQNI